MCGRYARKSAQELLAEWFDLDLHAFPFFLPSYNVAPQSMQPVIWQGGEAGERRLSLMRWGLVPSWARDQRIGLNTINARAEEVTSKPAFREALKKRRCLIPADAFYEWQRRSAKVRQPWAIGMKSGDPFAFAGLWDTWQPPVGEALASFTILTTAPNEQMAPIHDRMPVIVEPRNYDRWLDAGNEDAPPMDLLQPYPAEEMQTWTVSNRVGKVTNDEPDLLKPERPEQESLFD